MKKMLMRPTAALFPAVLLVSTLVGDDYMAINMYYWWLVLQLGTLCSADAFRNAAAQEPGIRRVDRRFSGTWLMLIPGILLLLGYMMWASGTEASIAQLIVPAIPVVCIYIEQMFEERMFALSRRTDGVVLSVISNILLLLGLLMDNSGGVAAPIAMDGFYTACAAGLGMVISIATSYGVEMMHGFSLKPVNIPFFPKAAAQGLLYSLAVLPVAVIGDGGVLAGLMIWRLSRTVCRRSADESRKLNLMLVAACAALIIAGIWLPLQQYALGAIAAMVCAAVVYCAPGWRLYAGMALVIAACGLQAHELLPQMWNMGTVILLGAAAIILNAHKAFLRKV